MSSPPGGATTASSAATSTTTSRLPPLGASALRQAVLASAASQTSYDRKTQDLLDKVTDVLSFGPSGLRSNTENNNNSNNNNKNGSSSSVGGSNMATHTTVSVVDGRRKQVTALKMDPPSAFDDLREPPRAVKQQILAQLARRNKKKKQQQLQQGQTHHHHQFGELSSFGSHGGDNNNGYDEDDDEDDDDDDYEKKRDRERRQIQQDEDAEHEQQQQENETHPGNNNNNNSNNNNNGGGNASESAVFRDSKKAAAAAAKPIPYYLRKGNRNTSTGTNATNQSETMMKSREIVIALGSDRMDSTEMQRVIEHEYAVRMCEQLGIAPSATNIARIHKKLPLSECSVTQVMHPGLARGERRNCISIVPKFVKEQEERKLAALRGERNALWNRSNIKKKEDLDETELMALLRTEEISRQRRQATATIQAHLQHMPVGTSTTAGILMSSTSSSSGTNNNNNNNNNNQSGPSSNNSGGGGGGGTQQQTSGSGSQHHQISGKDVNSSSSSFVTMMTMNGGGGMKTNAFDDIKNRFVFPFNEPVNNNRAMEGAFEKAKRQQRQASSSTSPPSSSHAQRRNNNNNNNNNTIDTSDGNKKSKTNDSTKIIGGTTPLGLRKNNNNHQLHSRQNQNQQDEELQNPRKKDLDDDMLDLDNGSSMNRNGAMAEEGYGQDRTDARLAMQDKLIQQKLIEREKERRRKEIEEEDARRMNAPTTSANLGTFNKNNNNNVKNIAPSQQNDQKLKTEPPDLRRLLSETDVVRLSKAQLERLAEQRAREETKLASSEEPRSASTFHHRPHSSTSSVDAIHDGVIQSKTESSDNNNNNNNNKRSPPKTKEQQQQEQEQQQQIETIDVSAMYKQHLVPPHVITECAGIPPLPAKIDLDEIRRQFLRNVPINDIFGADIGPLLKSAILSEALLKAQESTIEFFTDVCFLGPVRRSELLHPNGRWLHKHVSSTSIDLQFSKMYETCTKLLRDRGGTASVSRVVTRAAVLFLMLRVTIRSYFVRRSPGLISFDAGNQLLTDMDGIFCASIDPGCLYARVPQLESMPQALRVLHAKRANRTGRRHALNPKAVSAKLQFVLGDDSKVLRRFQSMGSRSFEPVVLHDHPSSFNTVGTKHGFPATSTKTASHGGREHQQDDHDERNDGDNDENDDNDDELEEQADLLSHFLNRKEKQQQGEHTAGASNQNNMKMETEGGLDFGDDARDRLKNGEFDGSGKFAALKKLPVEQTQKHITRGLAYLKRVLSPNVKTLLLDLKV